jgi:hypothetical protein
MFKGDDFIWGVNMFVFKFLIMFNVLCQINQQFCWNLDL